MLGQEKHSTLTAALIGAWYLLLLYITPARLPYNAEDAQPVIAVILIALQVFLICSLAVFLIKLAKPWEVKEAPEASVVLDALKLHFVTHIRILFVLSILASWTRMTSSLRGDGLIFMAMATVPLFVLVSAFSRLLVDRTGPLLGRRSSPEGWLAAFVVLATLIALIKNFSMMAQYTWALIVLIFSGATERITVGGEAFRLESLQGLSIAFYWLAFLYYVFVLWTNWRRLVADACSIRNIVTSAYGKVVVRRSDGSND